MKNQIVVLLLFIFNGLMADPDGKKSKVVLSTSNEEQPISNNSVINAINKCVEYNAKELIHYRNRLQELQIDSVELSRLATPVNMRVGQGNASQSNVQKVDSMIIYRAIISRLSDSLQQQSRKIFELKRKEAELNEYVAQVYQLYNKPFDTLVLYITESSLERDYKLFSKTDNIPKGYNDLKIYFNAKRVLDKRFNQSMVDLYLKELNKIGPSNTVEDLKNNLSYYSILNNSLITIIKSIINDIDEQKKASGFPAIEAIKKKDIMSKMAEFYRDNELEPGVYTYVERVLKSVLKAKVSNPDTDISPFLNQL